MSPPQGFLAFYGPVPDETSKLVIYAKTLVRRISEENADAAFREATSGPESGEVAASREELRGFCDRLGRLCSTHHHAPSEAVTCELRQRVSIVGRAWDLLRGLGLHDDNEDDNDDS